MKKKPSLYLISILLLFLSGCLGTKFLKEDQNLLYKQKLEGATDLDSESLESFYQTKPNKRIPLLRFAPYVYVYQAGKKKSDKQDYEQIKLDIESRYTEKIDTVNMSESKQQNLKAKMNKKLAHVDRTVKEGNLLMRWGEPLAIYDSIATERTTEQLTKYLKSIGFFNASVDYDKKVKGRKVEITYRLDRKASYTIDSLLFDVADPKIDSLMKVKSSANLLKKGSRYDQAVLTAERSRLYELMSNSGYYDFSRQYISFAVDSSSLPNRGVIVKTIILNPPNTNKHKVFTLDSVFFYN